MSLKMIDLPVSGGFMYESKHQEGDVVEEHHHQIHQILYALEGEGYVTLGNTRHFFSQDCAAMIVPNTYHSVVSESKLTLLVLAFDKQSLDSQARDGLLNPNFSASVFNQLNPFTGGEIRQLLRKLLFEQSSQDVLGSWAFKIYLLQILLVLARANLFPIMNDSNSLRADRIRTYIDTHYYEPLSATDIASRLGISVRHVNNIFKDQYRLTPTQYLAEVRIGLAKKLLAETDKDIVSICFEVGYETLPTFYRAFKNIVNMSPNQFRLMDRK